MSARRSTLLSRTLISLSLSAVAIALLLARNRSSGWLGLHDAILFLPIVTGFCSLGLLLLIPFAALLSIRRVSFAWALVFLTLAGAALGYLLLNWADFAWHGSASGTATAAIWAAATRSFLFPARAA